MNFTDYDIYVFFLCLIVFIMLTTLSVVCVSIITRLSLRLIKVGAEDQKIIQEHEKNKTKKATSKYVKLADYIFSGIVCLVFIVMLAGALIIRFGEDTYYEYIPNYRVVRTGSMAKKHPNNTYLEANNLNNQLQTFDLIKTEKIPDQMDLKLYDVVVYETNGILILHRIVEIEEPNEAHPNERYFRLQGDAVESPDRFPVRYEQMRAIYTGDRIPFVGSFIMFMQSPAGWLCTLLIVFTMIAAPILDKKLQDARNERLRIIHTRKRYRIKGGTP